MRASASSDRREWTIRGISRPSGSLRVTCRASSTTDTWTTDRHRPASRRLHPAPGTTGATLHRCKEGVATLGRPLRRARREPRGFPGRDQEGLPQAGTPAAPGRQPLRGRGRALQVRHARLRHAYRP
ncbi:hypothetical protein ACFPRL_31515 [Pseudoclavibacter helvolus]